MLTNNREWDILLHFDSIHLPPEAVVDSIPYISASSIKGGIRYILEPLKALGIETDYIFGRVGFASHMHFSSLRLDSSVEPPDIQSVAQVSLSRGDPRPGKLVRRDVLRNASFRGTVSLLNGGVYPSVFTYRLLDSAIPHLRLGSNISRGYGATSHRSRMSRNSESELEKFDPIQRIIRKATHQMISEIKKEPRLVYSLEWRDFERAMALVFEEIGFNVELTNASHDGGKDLVLLCISVEDGRPKPHKYYVELKHWKEGAKVDSRLVKKLLEVTVRESANGAVFIATSGFATNIQNDKINLDRKLHLGDLSTIHSLCKYYTASHSGEALWIKPMEEIFSVQL